MNLPYKVGWCIDPGLSEERSQSVIKHSLMTVDGVHRSPPLSLSREGLYLLNTYLVGDYLAMNTPLKISMPLTLVKDSVWTCEM